MGLIPGQPTGVELDREHQPREVEDEHTRHEQGQGGGIRGNGPAGSPDPRSERQHEVGIGAVRRHFEQLLAQEEPHAEPGAQRDRRMA
jgi:hypothetical protein